MRAGLQIVRIGNVAVSFLGTVVGGLVAADAGVRLAALTWLTLGLAAVSTAAITAGGNVLNDILDREGDQLNHPDRPLVTGALSVPTAKRLATGLFVGGAAVAVPVALHAPLFAAILVVAVAALLAYEFRWKARGLAGNLLVAALTGLVFLYGAAALGRPLDLLPFAAMAFSATFSREVIKDMEDVRGDTARSTLPRVYGPATAAWVARGAVALAILLSVVPLLWFLPITSPAGVAYAALVAAADATFILSAGYVPGRLHRAQSTSKVAMTVALAAFLAVAFR